MTLIFLFACTSSPGTEAISSASVPSPAAPLLPSHGLTEAGELEGWLRTLAAEDEVAELVDVTPAAFATIDLDGGERLFLYGTPEQVDAGFAGDVSDELVGVVIGDDVEGATCVGTLSHAPSWIDLVQGGLWMEDGVLTDEAGHGVELGDCRADGPSWAALAATQDADFLDVPDSAWDEAFGPPPPPSCSSTCGASESSASYAGQTAYSNGSYTGTGSSCAGGDSYQCTQIVDRVHGHYGGSANWTGNASTGYWTSTSNGPYQKGLVPFGSGTSYDAPLAGDVLVFSGGSYGHVSVLTSIGSSTVTVMDQNRSCGSQTCTEGYSTSSGYTISNGSGYCFSSSSYTPLGYARRGWDFGATYGLASTTSTTNWWPNDASYVSGSSTSSGSTTDITDYIAINPGATDPYLTAPAGQALPAYSSSATYGYKSFKVYMKSSCADKTAALYWKRTTDTGFAETRKVTATASSSWSTVTFNASSDSDWSGTIDQIRIDPGTACSSGSTDTIYLAYAWFDR